MAQTIYLARHGQTVFNVEDRMGGDSELTPLGVQQAHNLVTILNGVHLDVIYATPLRRSQQTARILCESYPGTPLIITPELQELSHGDMDGLSFGDFERLHPAMHVERRRDKYHWAFPNGESYELLSYRVVRFLQSLGEEPKHVCIVGHQGTNNTILGYFRHVSIDKVPHLKIPQDCMYVIHPSTNEVRIIP